MTDPPPTSRPDPPSSVVVTALDQEGRGVARVDGKAIFVEGALIGERVAVEVLRRKPNYEIARMVELHSSSSARVAPPCPPFWICGCFSLPHLATVSLFAVMRPILVDTLSPH